MACISKKVLTISALIVCFISSVFIGRVFSYDTNVAHPVLTEKIAQVYNNNFEQKLSDEEIRWLKQGSIEEDTAPRWLNHFYEPNINRGLGSFASAKNWAQSPNLQSAYLVSLGLKGNQTWQKAIESYTNNDKKSAFIALGHVLHLIEDVTVPAHTRLDAHPEGDPYEEWAMGASAKIFSIDIQPVLPQNLSNAFDKLAFYSNRYFFSKDTIDINILNNSKIKSFVLDNKFIDCYIYKDSEGKEFCIVSSDKNFINPAKKVYYLTDKNHSDYFSLLAPKAVSYGAGVIKLFFKEVEKRKKEEKQKSWWDKTKDWFKNNVNNFSSSLLNLAGDNKSAENNNSNQNLQINENALINLVNEDNSQKTNSEKKQETNNIVSIKPEFNVQQDNSAQNDEGAGEQQGSGQKSESGQQKNEEISENKSESNNGQAENSERSKSNEKQNQKTPEEFSTSSNSNENSNLPPGSSIGASRGGAQTNEQDDSNASTTPTNLDITPPETNATSALFSNNQTIATSTAIFEFSSSESNSTFQCQLDNATSTVCVSPKQYNNLADGSHIFKVWAIDQANNQDQTPAIFNWTIDATAPSINLELLNYNLMSINFSVQWNSSSTDVSSYEIQYKINASGQWQDWASGATASQKSFRATYDDTIYYFRGRTADTIGNQSAWQKIQAEVSLTPVVINEVAWMGTIVSPRDEWIELYNKTGQDINLGQWVLNATDGNPLIALTGVIPARGYFLLERTDDQTVPDVTADLIYPGDGVSQNMLANGGEELELKNAGGNIIDYIPYQSNWFAGSNAESRTMERINPYLAGTSAENWATYSGAGAINGTPKAQNSQYDSNFSASTTISDTTIISRDTIWTLKGSPYLLESNFNQSPTLSASATLIIEPGVIIKPQNKYCPSLVVKGTLLAQGIASQQIKFTSKENSPQAGDWGAIVFEAGSDNSILDNVIFEYGGYKSDAQTCYMRNGLCEPINGMAMIYDSSPQIKNSTFQYSQYGGIWLNNSDANIINCSFSDNLIGAAIRGANSQPIISGSVFQNQNNSGIGIDISDGASPNISSNNISGYSQAVYLESAYPVFSQNTVSNNSYNGIYVSHQSLFLQNATWQNNLTYLLMSNSGQYPTIATGTVLTIEPGVVIKPLNKNYTALRVNGRLVAEGTSSQKIVFTAFSDDSFGGDSNNDSGATVLGNSGEWRNIVFAAGSQGSLKYINFKYGGFIPRFGGWMDDSYDSAATLEIEPGADVVQGDGVLIE